MPESKDWPSAHGWRIIGNPDTGLMALILKDKDNHPIADITLSSFDGETLARDILRAYDHMEGIR